MRQNLVLKHNLLSTQVSVLRLQSYVLKKKSATLIHDDSSSGMAWVSLGMWILKQEGICYGLRGCLLIFFYTFPKVRTRHKNNTKKKKRLHFAAVIGSGGTSFIAE